MKLRSKSKNISTETAEEPSCNNELQDEDVSVGDENSLSWLEENAGPYETAEKHWIASRNQRLDLLKSTEISTHVYLEKFPVLSTIDGYKLVSFNLFNTNDYMLFYFFKFINY